MQLAHRVQPEHLARASLLEMTRGVGDSGSGKSPCYFGICTGFSSFFDAAPLALRAPAAHNRHQSQGRYCTVFHDERNAVMRYSRQDVLRILRIHSRQLSAWERAGLVATGDAYSFQD